MVVLFCLGFLWELLCCALDCVWMARGGFSLVLWVFIAFGFGGLFNGWLVARL